MLAGDLVAGPDAPGAQIKTHGCAVHDKRRWLNVGEPGPAGMLLGMAYPVPKTQGFSAHITFNGQF